MRGGGGGDLTKDRHEDMKTDGDAAEHRRDLLCNPSAACAAAPSLCFLHFALIILQRNKLNLSAGNLIEVSSWKSFSNLKEEDRPLIIRSLSSYTVSNCCRDRTNALGTLMVHSVYSSLLTRLYMYEVSSAPQKHNRIFLFHRFKRV